jgi:hypothetical protein
MEKHTQFTGVREANAKLIMGRTPCCVDHKGQKRGTWTAEEDQILIHYLQRHGLSNWRTLPRLAGLSRCGKSCRLRWTNYLRPGIKRGAFTIQEDLTTIRLHAVFGNKWSAIASHLGRTDNEIKNRWNSKLKKQLRLMGIDPVTHKSLPMTDYMHSFIASSSTVEFSTAAGCNTASVESELARDDLNIPHVSAGSWQLSQNRNLSGTSNNTVEPPVCANLPGARPTSENLLSLPSISMDQLLRARTSRWLHDFQNEINEGFDSRQKDRIRCNASLHETLQFSNLESKSEGMANINSSELSSNLKNETDVFRDIPAADIPADLVNKGDEINYWYSVLNSVENSMSKSNFH